MKVLISESQYNRVVDYFITFLFEPHEVKKDPLFTNSIFWIKNGKVIAQIENSENLWLDSNIRREISKQFGLNKNETQSVIKHWLEQHYGLGGLTLTHVDRGWWDSL